MGVASLVLAGTMVWVAAFFAVAFALDSIPVAVAPWVRYLFLGSLLVVRSNVVVVGAIELGLDERRGPSGSAPSAPG
ncbi:MAG TPA: hypothetical protein VEY12_04170 [Thermoplasmata archaeon]|nr:hypothetical protein [Thermoplasmata archaeon]